MTTTNDKYFPLSGTENTKYTMIINIVKRELLYKSQICFRYYFDAVELDGYTPENTRRYVADLIKQEYKHLQNHESYSNN